MPRTDDYIENDAGSSPYDIVLNSIGLDFYGDDPVQGKFGPGLTTNQQGPGEIFLIFKNYSNGMGMAYSGVPDSYAFGKNVYTRTRNKFMPGGKLTEIDLSDFGWSVAELGGEIRCATERFGDVFVGAGRHIIKLPEVLGTPVDEYDTGVDTQIDSALLYNNTLLFSTDQSYPSWQYLTAYDDVNDVWVTANSTGVNPSYPVNTGADNYSNFAAPVYLQKMIKIFQEVDGQGGFRIVGNNSDFTYTQTQTTAMNTMIGDFTAWSSALQAGDTSYGISGLYETNRIFFIGKFDSVRGIESSGIYCPNYVPDLEKNPSIYNGICGEYFDGRLFVGTAQGVLMIEVNDKQRQDIPTYVSPSFFGSNETPIFGIPTAMEPDNGWLAVSLWNGEDSHLCYMRPRTKDDPEGPSPVIWHGSECTIEGERITMLFKSSAAGRPLMLIGTHDGTRMHLYYLSLPKEGDPYQDFLHNQKYGLSGHKFATTCELFLSFQDAEDSTAKKIIRRFDVQGDGLSLPEFDPDTGDLIGTNQAAEINFYANANSGSRIFFETVEPTSVLSEWELQGVISDSPKATMIPTLSTISGTQIGIRLVCNLVNQSGDELNPVYTPFSIRSIKIRADLVVEPLEERTYTVHLGSLKATNTSRDQNDFRTKYVALTALQDADAVYMIDEWQEKLLVKVKPGISYRYIRLRQEREFDYILVFTVVFIGRQFYWDVSHTYDGTYAWG